MVASQNGSNWLEKAIGIRILTVVFSLGQYVIEAIAAKNGAFAIEKEAVDVPQIVVESKLELHCIKRFRSLTQLDHGESQLVEGASFLENTWVDSSVDALVAHDSHVVQDGSKQFLKSGMGGRRHRAINEVHEAVQTKAIVGRDSLAAIKRVDHFIKRNSEESQMIFAEAHLGPRGRSILGTGQELADGFRTTSKMLECLFRLSLKDEVNRLRVHLLKYAECLPLLGYHG